MIKLTCEQIEHVSVDSVSDNRRNSLRQIAEKVAAYWQSHTLEENTEKTCIEAA